MGSGKVHLLNAGDSSAFGSFEEFVSPFKTYRLPPKPKPVANATGVGYVFADVVQELSVPSELTAAE